MFEPAKGVDNRQRGITGLETAIILIAFVVVASVFAFTVLSAGIFTSERSKETIHAGLEEARSTLEPRGSVTAFSGRLNDGTQTIYKISFVVGNAVRGEIVDLTPPYSTDDSGTDPDEDTGAQYRTVISYSDARQHLPDVPWTIRWLGYSNGDNVLDLGEKAEITVWLLDRNTGTAIDDNGSVAVMTSGGITNAANIPGINSKFTIEVKPPSGAVVTLERTLPARLEQVMDLK